MACTGDALVQRTTAIGPHVPGMIHVTISIPVPEAPRPPQGGGVALFFLD